MVPGLELLLAGCGWVVGCEDALVGEVGGMRLGCGGCMMEFDVNVSFVFGVCAGFRAVGLWFRLA